MDLGNLARDISAGEKVEAELDNLIRRRGEQRRESEGERRAEEMYAESVKVYKAARERERRAEWAAFHRQPSSSYGESSTRSARRYGTRIKGRLRERRSPPLRGAAL